MKKFHRLRFHEIPIVDIEYTIFIKNTINQNDIIKIKFVIIQPFQNARFYNIKDISKTIKIVSSKRDLRDKIHYYNYSFQRFFQYV